MPAWLIVLLALGAPVWCCGMPRAMAGGETMVCHQSGARDTPSHDKPARNRGDDTAHPPHCPSHPQPQDQNPPDQKTKPDTPAPECDCPSPDAIAVPAQAVPHIGAVLGDAPPLPITLALLPTDLSLRIAARPIHAAQGMPPPLGARATLARLCMLTL